MTKEQIEDGSRLRRDVAEHIGRGTYDDYCEPFGSYNDCTKEH